MADEPAVIWVAAFLTVLVWTVWVLGYVYRGARDHNTFFALLVALLFFPFSAVILGGLLLGELPLEDSVIVGALVVGSLVLGVAVFVIGIANQRSDHFPQEVVKSSETYKTLPQDTERWEGVVVKPERPGHTTSVVYFIGNKDEGLVKIGYTTSLDRRLRTIQTSSPFPVSLFHAEPGTPDDERVLHQKFAHLRKSGEWFWLEPPIQEYIQGQVQKRHRDANVGPLFGY